MTPFQEAGVTAQSLIPCQRKTDRDFRVATDFRVVQMLKHPFTCEFHSIAEYYHAALLEGDPTVTQYVPQPFLVMIGKRRYVPDCYVVRNGRVEVVELRPGARCDERRRKALEAYFRTHHMRFVVIANDAIMSRRTEAGNWHLIVQALVSHRNLDTTHWEMELLDKAFCDGSIRFGELVFQRDRASSRGREIALLRLLHQGKLTADLTEHRFGYKTELRPWH